MNEAEFRKLWSGLTDEQKKDVKWQARIDRGDNDEQVVNLFVTHPHVNLRLHEALGVPTDAEKVAAKTLSVSQWTLYVAAVGTLAAIVGAWAAIKALPHW